MAPRKPAAPQPEHATPATGPAFVGNRGARQRLSSMIQSRVPHALIFAGPEHVGKRRLAHWLAAALLCARATGGEPCGTCSSCARIARGTHPDVQTFSLTTQAEASSRATTSRELGIDTVRALVDEISLRPFEADRKVYVIEDAHTMTVEAANSFLKTLEEPPPFATIILLAIEDSLLPETIRSRCTLVRFSTVAEQEIRAMLSRFELDDAAAARIASLAHGRPGWAVRAASDFKLVEQHDTNVSAMLSALHAGVAGQLALAEKLAQRWRDGKRTDVYDVLFDWLGYWRAVLMVSSGQSAGSGYAPFAPQVQAASAGGPVRATRAAERIIHTIRQLDDNAVPRLALETLLLDLAA